jgi:hypothetical protein
MKILNTIAAAAVMAAMFSGAAKAGNFETDLQSLKNSMPVPAAAEQVASRGEKLSGLGLLSNKMVAVKGKMERVDLALFSISRGMDDDKLAGLMGDLKECTAAARAFDAAAAGAIANTPKTPDTVAVAKLLLANVAEYTDNDETIALIRFEALLAKYPEEKDSLQPHINEYMKTLEALGRAGEKITKLSGLLGE